jgi:hypothetical protein
MAPVRMGVRQAACHRTVRGWKTATGEVGAAASATSAPVLELARLCEEGRAGDDAGSSRMEPLFGNLDTDYIKIPFMREPSSNARLA